MDSHPPGPRVHRMAQGMMVMARPYAWMQSRRRRYGNVFGSRFPIFGRVVYVADPADIKRVFSGEPDRVPRGRGQRARPG